MNNHYSVVPHIPHAQTQIVDQSQPNANHGVTDEHAVFALMSCETPDDIMRSVKCHYQRLDPQAMCILVLKAKLEVANQKLKDKFTTSVAGLEVAKGRFDASQARIKGLEAEIQRLREELAHAQQMHVVAAGNSVALDSLRGENAALKQQIASQKLQTEQQLQTLRDANTNLMATHVPESTRNMVTDELNSLRCHIAHLQVQFDEASKRATMFEIQFHTAQTQLSTKTIECSAREDEAGRAHASAIENLDLKKQIALLTTQNEGLTKAATLLQAQADQMLPAGKLLEEKVAKLEEDLKSRNAKLAKLNADNASHEQTASVSAAKIARLEAKIGKLEDDLNVARQELREAKSKLTATEHERDQYVARATRAEKELQDPSTSSFFERMNDQQDPSKRLAEDGSVSTCQQSGKRTRIETQSTTGDVDTFVEAGDDLGA